MILFINRLLWLPRLPFLILGQVLVFLIAVVLVFVHADLRILAEVWERQDYDTSIREVKTNGLRHIFRSFPR